MEKNGVKLSTFRLSFISYLSMSFEQTKIWIIERNFLSVSIDSNKRFHFENSPIRSIEDSSKKKY